jgi:hypothetical protein
MMKFAKLSSDWGQQNLEAIPSFVVNVCSEIPLSLLKFIVSLRLSTQIFPAVWKRAVIVTIFRKSNKASVNNSRPVAFLNDFAKIF